ncbi:MAG: glycosyltransferase family 4 protein [Anaerolineae bacterium]|nr:glycosyltransferase family 4 protein [Anaerolineae bacterium]
MSQPRLIYVANNRLPTEKAHGLQIVQMCEAFVTAGYDVTLVTSRRTNTPAMRAIPNLWTYYGVGRVFGFFSLPCLDLISLSSPRMQPVTFLIQTFTYLLVLWAWLLPRRANVFYTRDLFIGLLLRLARPRTPLVYEVHQVHHSRLGRRLQRFLVRRALVIPVTGHLADRLRGLGASRVQVEHDGVRLARFENLPSKRETRAALNIPAEAFVIGYVGRLHTMHMSKGLDTLVGAVAAAKVPSVHLLLVGGPDEDITQVRQQWAACGLPADHLHAVGQVPPDDVPRFMAAMDAGAMPLPWTEHFAYYASAIKLFEYMAAGCAVVASDLPGTAEVVRDGESALLAPPGDITAFAAAIRQLARDPALVDRLGARARADVQHYAWAARARRIRDFIEANG